MRISNRKAAFAMLSAVGAVATCLQSTQAQTWSNTAGGNWSVGTNWVGNTAPASAANTIVRFNSAAGQNYTATQDIANPFTLNGVISQPAALTQITIAGNQLNFTQDTISAGGPFAPQIANIGAGTLQINNPILINNPSGVSSLIYNNGTFTNTGQTNLTGLITGPAAPSNTTGAAVFNDSATSRLNLSGGGNNLFGIVGNVGTTAITGGTWNNTLLLRLAEDDNVTASMLVSGPSTVVNAQVVDTNFGINTTTNFTINNGAKVDLGTTGNVFSAWVEGPVGDPESAFATINIDGANSSLSLPGTTTAGQFAMAFGGIGIPAAGTLNITNGGSLTVRTSFLGDLDGTATINVSGAGSTYNARGQFLMESNTASTMNITNGGKFVTTGNTFTAATNVNFKAIVNVSGTNSLMDTSGGTATVIAGGTGTAGDGTLNVTAGGEVRANILAIADGANTAGMLLVDGANTKVTMQSPIDDNILFVGDGAGTAGTMTVSNGAQVNMGPSSPTGAALVLATFGSTGRAEATFNNSSLNSGTAGTSVFVGYNAATASLQGTATFNVVNNANVNLTAGGIAVGPTSRVNIGQGTTPATVRGLESIVDGRVEYNSGTFQTTGTMSVGGTVFLSSAARNAAGTPSNKKTLEVGTLQLTASGVVDLNDNDAIFKSTSYTTVSQAIRTARNNGAWNQPGITSTAAKNASPQNKTLGTLRGDEFHAAQGAAATFNGRTVANSDTLVKYTYYGDATFDGRITFDDYAKIDSGFNAARTGWFNGDFNYDGVINFDDYGLIDQAFLTQGSTVLGRPGGLAGPGDDREIIMAGLSNLNGKMTVPHVLVEEDAINPNRLGAVGGGYKLRGDGDPNGGSLRAVPEPAALGVIGLAIGAIGARRRRSR